VNRRALLLLGALLMPTAARAQTTNRQPAKKMATAAPARPAPAAAPPRPVAAPAPSGPQALREARSQLVAFNASAFPYRGMVPGTTKPFLDVKQGRRRGHTTLKGDVCWEETTYSDRRSLLYLPAGFNPAQPFLIVLYLHGQGATLERDVVGRQGIPRQVAASGQNVALVAPQLAFDAADSSAGNFWRPGHFAQYIDEAAERLMRLYGDKRVGPRFNAAPVVIVSYSGGYLPAAYALERGGAAHRVRGIVLMDALYGDEDKFAGWVAARRNLGFLLSAYTESTQDENGTLQKLLDKRRIPFGTGLPASLAPGTMAFLSCGSRDLHNEFMTHAWTGDPLAQVLTRIPGFAQTPPAPAAHSSSKT
jgi:hypothetical protein